jgi:hypothetical protein
MGHWLIAQAILAYLGAKPTDAVIEVDARQARQVRGRQVAVAKEGYGFTLTWSQPVPMPAECVVSKQSANGGVTSLFEQIRLKLTGATAPNYRIVCNTTELATVTRQQLATGTGLLDYAQNPLCASANDLMERVHTERAMLTDAWLTFTGHKRPGMAVGLPIDQADASTRRVDVQIGRLALPQQVVLQIVPVK